ncbi:unnamed protein product [Allacma fusca]|uniref:DUF5641 domain-containing protein n=1 Tax=Allacma fusca TaxID=39272 RepID=A0A8J2JXH8_9HEXA|nr:unnamed protein product [Allacma fusca]
MNTLLIQIEACLNSRPLSPLSNDPTDLLPLTPGHFVIGDTITARADSTFVDNNTTCNNNWKKVQKLHQNFWRRWSSEYLTRLQQRPKWLKQQVNIAINDLVLVKDERFPPLKWKLGRVTEVHPGTDGLVRVVTLKTAEGVIKRPITKICQLPIN